MAISRGAVVACAVLAFGTTGGPASAAGVNATLAPGVSGFCSYVEQIPGSGSFSTQRVVLEYEVVATGPGAFATNGTCTVYNAAKTVVYGSISAFGVGPRATAVGWVDIPRSVVTVVVCNVPQALYLDGTEGNPNNEMSCTVL